VRPSFVLLLTVSACAAPFRTTIELSEAELQSRLDQRFPIEKSAIVAKVALDHPHVLLDATSDRIGIECEAHAIAVLAGEHHGKVGVSGRLEYDRETSTVYLVDPEIVRAEFPDLPQEHLPMIRDAASIALKTNLARIPLHHLDGVPERALVQSVDVKEGRVIVELGL